MATGQRRDPSGGRPNLGMAPADACRQANLGHHSQIRQVIAHVAAVDSRDMAARAPGIERLELVLPAEQDGAKPKFTPTRLHGRMAAAA